MKIVSINANWVTPRQMEDGQIGVIRKWNDEDQIGKLVQKYKEQLIVLGERSGQSFPNGGTIIDTNFMIEILQPGALLEI